MVILPAWLVALSGCGPSQVDAATVIDELTVLNVRSDPPEASPGEEIELRMDVVDPAGGTVDLLGWFGALPSTNLPEGTPLPDIPLGAVSFVVRDAGPAEVVRYRVPPEAGLLTLDPTEPARVPFLVLACRPGVCPVIDLVDADPAPASADWVRALELLTRPTDWLPDLPAEDAFLALRLLRLSTAGPGARNRNPRLVAEGSLPASVGVGEVVPLRFSADEGTVFPFTTAGGFTFASAGLLPGRSFELLWVTPDAPAEAEIAVVVEDGVGGSDIWRARVSVVDP